MAGEEYGGGGGQGVKSMCGSWGWGFHHSVIGAHHTQRHSGFLWKGLTSLHCLVQAAPLSLSRCLHPHPSLQGPVNIVLNWQDTCSILSGRDKDNSSEEADKWICFWTHCLLPVLHASFHEDGYEVNYYLCEVVHHLTYAAWHLWSPYTHTDASSVSEQLYQLMQCSVHDCHCSKKAVLWKTMSTS